LKKHIRHVIFWLYEKCRARGAKAKGTEIAREIREVYGNGAVSEDTCQRWLSRFRESEKPQRKGLRSEKNVPEEVSNNQNIESKIKDKPRSGRPSTFDDNELQRLIGEDPKVTIRELLLIFQVSVFTIHEHLHKLGYVCFLFKNIP
jgi:transposase